MEYLAICVSSDGLTADWLTKDELLSRITPNEIGETYYSGVNPINFLKDLPDFGNPGDEGVYIVKAEVCTPTPIETHVNYSID